MWVWMKKRKSHNFGFYKKGRKKEREKDFRKCHEDNLTEKRGRKWGREKKDWERKFCNWEFKNAIETEFQFLLREKEKNLRYLKTPKKIKKNEEKEGKEE